MGFTHSDRQDNPVHAVDLCFAFRDREMLVGGEGGTPIVPRVMDLPGASESCHYVGELDGVACRAFAPAETEITGYRWIPLRSLFGSAEDSLVTAASAAAQILDWARDHAYCGRCGSRTERSGSDRSYKCPSCGLSSFPRISPAIIVAVTHEDLILLGHNNRHKQGLYSTFAGFVEPGESLETAVRREVFEETSIEVDRIEYFGSQSWPFPNALMVGFNARYAGGELRADGTEIADARWFSARELPEIPPRGTISRRLIDAFLVNCAEHWR